jgi:nicotinamidase/pyrazinamidase
MNPRIDSYSGFFDNGHRASTGMGEWLKARGVGKISVAGVATELLCEVHRARRAGRGV